MSLEKELIRVGTIAGLERIKFVVEKIEEESHNFKDSYEEGKRDCADSILQVIDAMIKREEGG